jgi:hypothetical protein
MSNSQSDSRGAAPRQRAQKTAAPSPFVDVTEQKRLNEAREAGTPWKKWGPYLSERQWGTVREDYSQDGNAWAYFSHDQSRARAYRWGEDGIGGFSDDEQRLCFALALWNEGDPILENETNTQHLWDQPNASPWVKDAFHQYVVSGNSEATNPTQTGTKAAARYVLDVPAGGSAVVRLLSPLSKKRLERVLGYLLDENEFLSPYGIRSLSRYHQDHPFVFDVGGQAYSVSYVPAESNTGMFGGNSNWRGPVWMPVNVLIVRGLLNLYGFYGEDFTVECPTGSGNRMTLFGVAEEISRRLASIFLRDEAASLTGRRPVYGGTTKFQDDPHWRDFILFYEYFHGDNGAGLGSSHQTGWTGVIARLLDLFGRVSAADVLLTPKERLMALLVREQVGGKE